ncbi:hypothetical protein FB446DRAFT_801042 [Lentinula raphanica]|nr:hypothetical protein FB446DRAFT_801042 [Lentinula raphanica]
MTAPPLPSPPEHLLNNSQISATLQSMFSYIKVDTPFNMDHLELLFNQPFVASVIRSLREGSLPLSWTKLHQVLNDVIKEHSNEKLVLFKSEVAKAFFNLPAPSGKIFSSLESPEIPPNS